MPRLTDHEFEGLLAVRSDIAAFEQRSEKQARIAGATHVQHHVLLAVRGHADPRGPTVKEIAAALGISSPSAVELLTRMVRAGLVTRGIDTRDARATRHRMTDAGRRLLDQLSGAHLPRLRELADAAVGHLRG